MIDRDVVLSYAELHALARAFSGTITAVRGRRLGPVAILMEKGALAVAAIHGAVGSGGSYVPLDPAAPDWRVASILNHLGPTALICTRVNAQRQPVEAWVDRLILAEDVAMNVEGGATGWSSPSSNDVAYVLFTSGSTGDPKGVAMSFGSLAYFIDWALGETELGPHDVVASVAPLHFDISTFDLFAAASVGATLVLIPSDALVFPRKLPGLIQSHGVTVWYSVPSVLTRLIEYGSPSALDLRSLRIIAFAGEVFPRKQLTRLMNLTPQATHMNWYGPTETNVCVAHRVSRRMDRGNLPIGRPLPGTTAEVADGGELIISGPGVMLGYWPLAESGAAELTERIYRTGDIVRVQDSGELLFVGRRDTQVKVAGNRVELGEIETTLASHASVREAVVVAVHPHAATNSLVAFVTVADESTDPTPLIELCRERLPRYAVPHRIVVLSDLPRTSTGKIDRGGLELEASRNVDSH